MELSPDTESLIRRLAERFQLTPDALVSAAVVALAEDYADLNDAVEISRRIRAGEEKTIGLAEIEARLGLGG